MTPLQKSIAEIEALHAAYDGMDNARTVVSHIIEILTANLEYEREEIKKAWIDGSYESGILGADDYYTKTYENERKD